MTTEDEMQQLMDEGRQRLLAMSSDYTAVEFERKPVGSTQGETTPGFTGPGEWDVKLMAGETVACHGTGVTLEAAISNAEKAAVIDIAAHGRATNG